MVYIKSYIGYSNRINEIYRFSIDSKVYKYDSNSHAFQY